MTARLLTAAACVVLSLLCLWIVDPENRNAAFMAKGAVWGLAGILVVALLQLVVARRRAPTAQDHRVPQ